MPEACGSGPGPNAFGNQYNGDGPPTDNAGHHALLALMKWVEHGVAPEQIIATKYKGDSAAQGIVAQRPICPYPAVAKYKGSGDVTKAASFSCEVTP